MQTLNGLLHPGGYIFYFLKFQMEFGDALVGVAVDDFEDEAIVDVDVADIE